MIETTIVCPFCPLACDDVQVVAAAKASQLPVVKTTCQLADHRFRFALQPAQARIADTVVSLDDIHTHMTALAAKSKHIIVITSGVDLATAKALQQLDTSGKINWVLDQSPLAQSWQRTSSRDGIISATLGDVREHADLIWMIGDVESSTPRMKEVLMGNRPSRRVIATPGPFDLDSLAALSLASRMPGAPITQPDMSELAEAIESSKYFAVIIGDDAFADRLADAALSLLIQWTWSLNAKRRAVVVRLDEAATNRAVYRWRTNRSLGSVQEISHGVGTLTVRIGESIADHSKVDVAIGTCDPGVGRASVFVPCAIVGVHEAGAKIRGDGTVTLPLAKITDSDLPLAVQWIERMSA